MRNAVIFSIVLAVLMLAAGCDYGNMFKARTTSTQTVGHLSNSGIAVTSSNGNVEVVALASSSNVQIDAKLTCGGATQAEADARIAKVQVEAIRDEQNTLHVRPIFPGGRQNGDGASFRITVPAAVGASVDTSNGNVKIEGLSGALVVDTSNGSVDVIGHDGDATLDSSNGNIVASNINGAVHADTSNGGVTLEDVAGTVYVDTSNGNIVVELATGQIGPVTLDSSNGGITLQVDAAFAGVVEMSTSNAKVHIDDQGSHLAKAESGRKRGTATFSHSGAKSIISTSNGSIRLIVTP